MGRSRSQEGSHLQSRNRGHQPNCVPEVGDDGSGTQKVKQEVKQRVKHESEGGSHRERSPRRKDCRHDTDRAANERDCAVITGGVRLVARCDLKAAGSGMAVGGSPPPPPRSHPPHPPPPMHTERRKGATDADSLEWFYLDVSEKEFGPFDTEKCTIGTMRASSPENMN